MELTVASRFEGATGRGQGGYTAGLLSSTVGIAPLTVTFRAPVPLDRPMRVVESGPGHEVYDDDRLILEAGPADDRIQPLAAVSLDEAEAGRRRAEESGFPDRIVNCYSCGGNGSLRVHAGPVPGTDVFATAVTYPEWTATGGVVALPHLWAPVDCAAGYRVAFGQTGRLAFTGWLTVVVHRPVRASEPLVVVAGADAEWDGRKRAARSAMYTADGELLVASESFWIAAA